MRKKTIEVTKCRALVFFWGVYFVFALKILCGEKTKPLIRKHYGIATKCRALVFFWGVYFVFALKILCGEKTKPLIRGNKNCHRIQGINIELN